MVKGPNKNYQTNNQSAEFGGCTRLSIFPAIMGHQTGNQARTGEGVSDHIYTFIDRVPSFITN